MKRLTFLLLLLTLTLSACRLPLRVATPLPVPPEAASPLPAIPSPEPSPAQSSPEPILDIRYSNETTEDPNRLSLDIYPASQGNAPVLVYVHGGGWYRGTKSNVDDKPRAFNQMGFTFVSVNYRLYPDVTIAQQMNDVAAAIAWTKSNIADHGGDPTRMFLMGHSAGAHLVSLVATDPSYLAAYDISPADIGGVIALDSQAYDLVTLLTVLPRSNGLVYRAVFGDDPANWKKYSPITYVTKGGGIPPFFLVYTSEKPGRYEITQLFADTLEGAGIPATIHSAVEKSHGEVNEQFGKPDDPVSAAVFVWLKDILAGL